MSSRPCQHIDVREFDGVRTCCACGDVWFRKSLDEAEPYVYTDLRCLEVGQTVRIVALEPGELSDPLHCTLELSDLRYANYHAVSYTWATEDGDATKSQPVYIDGRLLYVTMNCDAALRRLRRLGPHTRFWIDAMCINQSNIKERNHQVGLMDHIYRNAMRVHMCIDNGNVDYTNLMRRLDSTYHESSDMAQWLSAMYPESNGHFLSREMEAQLTSLFACRYFTRVWVIQEVALARKVTMHVNNDHLDLSREVITMLHKVEVPGLLRAVIDPTAAQTLEQRLRSSMKASCTDPRDQIYAIHSLLDASIRQLIPIDYSISVEEVFINAVVACIATTKSLKLLLSARLDTKESNCFSIGHFKDYLETPPPPKRPTFAYRTPITWNAYVSLEDPESSAISVPEQLLGQSSSPIEKVAGPLPPGQILPRVRVRAYHVDCVRGEKALDIGAVRRRRYDRQGLPGDRNHAPRFVRRHHGRLDSAPSLIGWSTVNSQIRPGEEKRHAMSLIEHLVEIEGHGNVFFDSTDGMGVCHASTRSGDQVYLLDGVDRPLILRPLDGDLGYAHRRFRIVSWCWWASLLVPTTELENLSYKATPLPQWSRREPSSQFEVIEVY